MRQKSSKYKGVSCVKHKGKYIFWRAEFNHPTGRMKSTHKTEREAAKAYDMFRIKIGKPPVNILKPL